jgi:hypothetical protein
MTPPIDPAARTVRFLALTMTIVAVALIALIAGGAFDPRPLGPLTGSTTPGLLSLAGRGETLSPQSAPFAAAPSRFSLRLSAAHAGGEADSGYGLALGDKRAALVVAVSPLGEAAVWQTIAGEDEPRYRMPWQPWPHVRPGIASNEIWLDARDEDGVTRVTARINRELLWEGEVEWVYPGAALWLGSFGGPVTVDFQTLDWFLPPPT